MTKSLTALLFTILLVACSRSEPDAPAQTNDMINPATPPVASPSPAVRPVPTPTPSPTPTVSIVLPPAAAVGANEQMLDDASATGMTARSERAQEEPDEPLPDNSEGH